MSDEPTPPPLHVVELHIDSVKRIHAAHIVPRELIGSEQRTIVIGGRNRQGKSSILDALEMAITGEICKRPINSDSDHAQVIAHLGEIIVKRTFTKSGGGTLTVSAVKPDGTPGAKVSSPQTLLNELYGNIAFDPLAFTQMKDDKQLETLRQICGINTTLIDAGRKRAFEERTEVNREVSRLEKALTVLPAYHTDAPAAEVSATELDAKLTRQRTANEARARVAEKGRKEVEDLKTFDQEIADIEAQLVEKREQSRLRHEALAKLRTEANAMDHFDNSELLKQIDTVSLTNAKVQENVRRRQAEAELATKRAEAAALTAKIEDFDKRKREKLENAKYPVAGLKLTDDGIEYDGQPWEQASQAEQLRVSVAIGIAGNPRLRVMLVRDAATLDDESLGLLEQMAEQTNTQVWIERVGKGNECHVIIEDGRIVE